MQDRERKKKGKTERCTAQSSAMDWAYSFVSFSLEKEVEEPWPLLLPGDVMIDPDPEGGVGDEGGELGE